MTNRIERSMTILSAHKPYKRLSNPLFGSQITIGNSKEVNKKKSIGSHPNSPSLQTNIHYAIALNICHCLNEFRFNDRLLIEVTQIEVQWKTTRKKNQLKPNGTKRIWEEEAAKHWDFNWKMEMQSRLAIREQKKAMNSN